MQRGNNGSLSVAGIVTLALALVASFPVAAEEPNASGSPLPPAEVIGFQAALDRALHRNPAAEVAREEVARAAALVEETRAASLPTLGLGLTYTRLDDDRRLASTTPGQKGSIISAADQINANLQLNVPILQPRAWVQWSHAKDGVVIAQGSLEDVRRNLALSTARTYLALIAQHRVIEVQVRARDAARAHASYAHQRYAGGFGTRVDEVRAAQEVAADESLLQSQVAQLVRLRETLGVLGGLDHPVDVTDEVQLPAPPGADEALQAAVSERADVRLAKERLHLAERLEHDTWADWTPSIVGTFTPFFQNPPTLTLPQWGWQVTLGLQWSIYDGGLRYGLKKERAATRRQAAATLAGDLRQAQSEVRTADEELRRAATSLAAARDAARLARDALDLTNLGYKAGATTNIEVIDAERRARDADTAVAVAEDALRQSQLDLLLASGRFPPAR